MLYVQCKVKVKVKVKKRLFDNGIVVRVSIIQKQTPRQVPLLEACHCYHILFCIVYICRFRFAMSVASISFILV